MLVMGEMSWSRERFGVDGLGFVTSVPEVSASSFPGERGRAVISSCSEGLFPFLCSDSGIGSGDALASLNMSSSLIELENPLMMNICRAESRLASSGCVLVSARDVLLPFGGCSGPNGDCFLTNRPISIRHPKSKHKPFDVVTYGVISALPWSAPRFNPGK